MGHDHHHTHDTSTGNIRVAFFLNFIFAIIELIGGIYTNSVSILSDALHDFGDSISLGVAWYLQKVSARRSDRFYSYGYKRFSLIGAIFISVVLLAGSVVVIKECIGRILEPQMPDAAGMFVLAILGIIVTGAAVIRLKRGSSLNERAVSLHMMEDVLGWVAVLIVSIVMHFVEWPILDPLLSIGISIWILTNVYRNLKATFRILLQKVPSDVDIERLEEEIRSTDRVLSIHDVHLWTLDGEENIMSLHAVIAPETTLDEQYTIKTQIKSVCASHGIDHATVEFETEEEACMQTNCGTFY